MGKSNETIEFRGVDRTKVEEPVLGDAPITGERYYDINFARKEWDKVWTKTWLIAGMENQLREVGDYITCEIGPESILCSRGKDGKIRAFYNVCQHRGNRLMDDEQGFSKNFTRRYHGWRFATDGELKFVPCAEDFPQGNPCGKLNLVELKCEVWAGFVWYSMNDDIAPLADVLGPLKDQIESYEMQNMKRTHWVTVEGEFNWKCVQDNFNESYHLPFVHPQTKYIMEQSYKLCQFDLYAPQGHTRMFMPGSRPTSALKGEIDEVISMMREELEFWDLNPDDYRENPHAMREDLQKVKRKTGAKKGFDYSNFNDDQLTDHYHYTLFPNVSFSLKPDGCIFLRSNPHPTDPNKCIFDLWYLMTFPEGVDEYYSHSMSEMIAADFQAPHVQGKFGDVSCGPAIDQDVAVWSEQQKGLRSRGFKRDYLSNQERRVRFWHEKLDAMIDA